ncbi:hypothetical protein OSB04_000360 [Centaurea solstitialis]|uniref:DNA topoisomerase (ATP-hydrolyzing) n=1 Tax=Centaurea solstitialis TaxID=347529 RepID=A0AA38WTT4_9ASTR|nr:hypothetical protein OSB04_000360 [Centaurea solstitialis]
MKFVWMSKGDGEAIVHAFKENKVVERRKMIFDLTPDSYLGLQSIIRYRDFVRKELARFFKTDVERLVPLVVDGLRLGQRKILFSLFKRNMQLYKEIRVEDSSGYVSECADYHHSNSSIHSVIIRMAQNIVGRNNSNLLFPCGEFRSRHKILAPFCRGNSIRLLYVVSIWLLSLAGVWIMLNHDIFAPGFLISAIGFFLKKIILVYNS